MVGSSRATTSPARTRSPSRTRSSPMTPPVGCCTFFTLESTTIWPAAIRAPESLVVLAQPPTPPASRANTMSPASTLRRMDRRVGEIFSRIGLAQSEWGFLLRGEVYLRYGRDHIRSPEQ